MGVANMRKKCKYCGVPFEIKAKAQKYCSYDCQKEGYKQVELARKKEKPCKVCGRMFKPASDMRSFCSIDCKIEHLEERHEEWKLEQILYGYEKRKEVLKKRIWEKRRNPQMEMCERLDYLLLELNITREELADGCGINRHTFKRFMEGETATLSLENIVKISEHTGKNIDWIMGY